jgi:hypothetical protein
MGRGGGRCVDLQPSAREVAFVQCSGRRVATRQERLSPPGWAGIDDEVARSALRIRHIRMARRLQRSIDPTR